MRVEADLEYYFVPARDMGFYEPSYDPANALILSDIPVILLTAKRRNQQKDSRFIQARSLWSSIKRAQL